MSLNLKRCRLPCWISSKYHLDVSCVSCIFVQEDPEFLHHSHQTSFGICELYVLAYQQLKSETRFEIQSCSLLDPLY